LDLSIDTLVDECKESEEQAIYLYLKESYSLYLRGRHFGIFEAFELALVFEVGGLHINNVKCRWMWII